MIDVSLEIPKSQGDFEWVQAQILSVGNDEILELNFIYDKWQQQKRFSMWSVKIEQFGIHTKDLYEQRDKVQIMMQFDINDIMIWYRSIILGIQERQEYNSGIIIKMAFIGYRVYCEQGNKDDEMGSFVGWSSKFDEWIPLNSLRIRPLLTQTLKQRLQYEKETFILPNSALQSLENVKYIVQSGIDIDETTGLNESTLFIACQLGRYDIVEYLISLKADINKRTYYYISPLIAAIQGEHFDIVRLLVENGADVNLNNNNIYASQKIKQLQKMLQLLIYDIQEFKRIKDILNHLDGKYLPDKIEASYNKINKNIFRKVITEYI
ncbi:ubiquitin carboxyl-terminal hydrolase family protein [Stylonychia lemnae]|uniref:Ubiquitin carboxyl-terminal hydrolase family protein n=1 Tax=Stylonychia lemnae TaxID=5949 RepID=A0A078B5R3_STYLE|nr:ubiquitin carboxyl-terminal hydrolase family protein [Stylonychia lemnae]|eukprot:CDW88647.1 ubiquitin carboxyl-terminal hydrolase family protein [Stylonychia lemnae]